jgi:hypothetical protein
MHCLQSGARREGLPGAGDKKIIEWQEIRAKHRIVTNVPTGSSSVRRFGGKDEMKRVKKHIRDKNSR